VAASLRSIGDAIGVSRAAPRYYFPSRDELEQLLPGRVSVVRSAAARFPARGATTMIDDLDKAVDLLERHSLRSARCCR
jgi:AcrR family transcriptional regulator